MKKQMVQTIRLRLLFLLLLLLPLSPKVIAQLDIGFPDPGGLTFKLAVQGKRSHDGVTKNIYNHDDPLSTVRHCDNNFIFVTYLNNIDTYALYTNVPVTGRSLFSVQWRISENGVYTYPGGTSFATTTERTSLPLAFSTTGYKYIQFIVNNPSLSPIPDTILAKILVIKKVTDVTIDAPAICLDSWPTGADYHFNVETIPAIETLLDAATIPDNHPEFVTSGGYCEIRGDLQLSFDFEPYPTSGFTAPVRAEFGPWTPRTNNFFLGGDAVLTWPLATLPISPWEDVKKFYYSNSDMMSYAGSSALPIVGSFNFSDGVTDIPKVFIIPISKVSHSTTFNNSSSYIIWEYDKTKTGTISGHTAEPSGTIDAPANETWTPDDNPMVNEGFGSSISTIRIKDKLVIGKGQSLTLKDMTIEMGKDAQIIVESDPYGIVEAGRLLLDNTTIKSYRGCGNETNFWYGITLHGNSSQSQATMGSSTVNRYQASLRMYNNSKIAEAQVAVGTYDPNDAPARAGGIIMADNTTFENNKLSVDFAQYYNAALVPFFTGYVSRFNHCTFTYNDENTMSSFEGFVQAVGVKDIPFTSCSFTTEFGTAMIGYGIRAFDASLLLRKVWSSSSYCYFKGLHDAVSVHKTAFGTSTTLYIAGAQFIQNYTGVFSLAVNNPYLHNNGFQVPPRPYPAFAGRNCSGVNIATGSGYTLTANIFSNIPAAPSSTAHNNAVLIWNSGSAPNEVKGNSISNLSQGLISNFINRGTGFPATGLQFLCNAQSSNVGTCIAALGGNPSQDGMRAEQGSNSQAAGNTFAHLYTDIYNPTAEVGAVSYFHNSAADAEPIILTGSASKSVTAASDGCASSLLPVISSTTGTMGATGSPVLTVPGPVVVSGLSGIALHEALLHNVAAYSLADTVPNRISLLHSTLAALGDAYSDLERVDLYLQANDTEAANSLYDGIATNRALSGTEAFEFSHWGRQLLDISIAQLQAGKTTRELNTTQVNILSLMADSAAMWAKVRAQNWLQLYDGRSFINTFLYPPDSNGGNQRRAWDNTLTGSEGQQNAVSPNPASDYIHVSYTAASNKENNIQLQLTDMLGRTVLQQAIANKGSQKIAVDKLAPGLYFYTIREQNNITLSGKLIKK